MSAHLDKVLCIDDGPHKEGLDYLYHLPNGQPKKGLVYAIDRQVIFNGYAGFVIVGFPAIDIKTGIDVGFLQTRFVRLEYMITHGDYYCQRVIGGAVCLKLPLQTASGLSRDLP